jgi:hypothetical protein
MDRLFGKKALMQNTPETDNSKPESPKLNAALSTQIATATRCIQLNLQLVHFLATCGSINKEQLTTVRDILNQSGLPASYTQNMRTVTDTVERNLNALLPNQLDEWRVNTTKDLSKEISIYLEFINKIDPRHALKMREMVQTTLIKMS